MKESRRHQNECHAGTVDAAIAFPITAVHTKGWNERMTRGMGGFCPV